jgi:ABC-type Fe3+ transport system substrate-binding protein
MPGVCYLTDVTPSVAKSVSTVAFPIGAAPEATYPIAIVKATKNAAAAQAFIGFVLSPEGQAFLKDRGFIADNRRACGGHKRASPANAAKKRRLRRKVRLFPSLERCA